MTYYVKNEYNMRKRIAEVPKSLERAWRRVACIGALGFLAIATGCTDIVQAQNFSMPVCRRGAPFSKAGNTPVRSVRDLTQDSEVNLGILRERALREPSRSLNITAAAGLVTLRQPDIPEVAIKSVRDVVLTLPSGDSRVTIIFPTDVHGKFNVDPEVFGCEAESGRAFYHNQLPIIIRSYATALSSD